MSQQWERDRQARMLERALVIATGVGLAVLVAMSAAAFIGDLFARALITIGATAPR